jgi:hypothetical protein
MSDDLKKLRSCINIDEVRELMRDKIYPNSDNSKFFDDFLVIRKSSTRYATTKAPKNLTLAYQQESTIDLAYRLLLYLRLDGRISKAPINGGCFDAAIYLKRVLRELAIYGEFNSPNKITSKMIDDYIKAQREKGNHSSTILTKIRYLERWHQYAYLFPTFLRLSDDLFLQSKEHKGLKAITKKENRLYLLGLGGTKEPYPLNQWAILMNAAIDYIEIYAEDCIQALKLYKDTKKSVKSTKGRTNHITKTLRNRDYQFREPLLKQIQEHAFTLPNNVWSSMNLEKRLGPVQVCEKSISKLQGASIIVVLMLTAMRRGEFDACYRYPKITKGAHHELDGSLNLERLIYKTASSNQGELHTIAVPPIVVKAYDYLSKISELMDGEKEGVLNLSSIGNEHKLGSENRINHLIENFCEDVEVAYAPTPHQFRHALAFLVAFLNDDIGIELAMTLLGHKSTEMTKKYMGHYKKIILETYGVMFDENEQMQEVLGELQSEENQKSAEKLIASIEKDEPTMGPIAKRLLAGYEFAGSVTEEGKVFFTKSIRTLIQRGMVAVVEHATHFCVRDKTKSEQLPCQIGITSDDFSNIPVVATQCQTSCGCRLYTEPQAKQLQKTSKELQENYPDDLVSILNDNTYYSASSSTDPHINKMLEEYEEKLRLREEGKDGTFKSA